MLYEELLEHFGGLTKAAQALDISKQTVHSWKSRGAIPFDAQYFIQLKTKGRLKASLGDLLRKRRAA